MTGVTLQRYCPCGTMFETTKPNKRFCNKKCRQAEYAKHIVKPLGNTKLSTGKKGAVGELLASADLLTRGYDVFRAVSQSCPCDLIAMKDGVSLQIEVRMATVNTKTGYSTYAKDRDGTRRTHYAIVGVDGAVTYDPVLEAK